MIPWTITAPATLAVGAAALAAYGAAHPRSQLFGPTTCRTDSAKKLALTFDDGPNPAVTPQLLDLLDRHDAKATFFLVGKFVRQCPALVKEIAARGHLLGNHTETHPNLFFRGPQQTREELLRCNEAIAQVALEEPRWFRPPFGFRSPWLGGLVQRRGMRTAMWTLLPGDWRAKPAEWLIERLNPVAAHLRKSLSGGQMAGTRATGHVLCLHDGDYTHLNADRSRALAALEFWLPRWRSLGLEFVTMSALTGKAAEV